MEDGHLVFVCQASSLGTVYGIYHDGSIHQISAEIIRDVTDAGAAGPFDANHAEAVFHPDPPPDYPITSAEVTPDGRCILLKGAAQFGAVRLDQKRRQDATGVWIVPFRRPCDSSTDTQVVSVSFIGDSIGVLRRDRIYAVYDSAYMRYPERQYLLKHELHDTCGISPKPRTSPVDVAAIPLTSWGAFSLLVLYDDGGIYLLCPVLPAGRVESELMRDAERQVIDRNILKRLLMEIMGETLKSRPVNIPFLCGPLNAGLPSEWRRDFEEGVGDIAVSITCVGSLCGMVIISTATSTGIIYTHALQEPVTPRIIPEDKAFVTTSDIRFCQLQPSGPKMRLIEQLDLQLSPDAMSLQMHQLTSCPSIMYVQTKSAFFRIEFQWLRVLISGNMQESFLENSEIWKFGRYSEFLGCYHDLGTSVAVFGKRHATTASIFRPTLLDASAMESNLHSLKEIDLIQTEHLMPGARLESDQSMQCLMEAKLAYEYEKLEDDDFDRDIQEAVQTTEGHDEKLRRLQIDSGKAVPVGKIARRLKESYSNLPGYQRFAKGLLDRTNAWLNGGS